MSEFVSKAQALRDSTDKHYNCAQAVFMAFSEKAGLDENTACRIAANFGAGMKSGGVCGAVTGGLMVLGLFDIGDAAGYYKRVKAAIGEQLNCSALLKSNEEKGGQKKQFCDGLITACVTVVEEMLTEQGKL